MKNKWRKKGLLKRTSRHLPAADHYLRNQTMPRRTAHGNHSMRRNKPEILISPSLLLLSVQLVRDDDLPVVAVAASPACLACVKEGFTFSVLTS